MMCGELQQRITSGSEFSFELPPPSFAKLSSPVSAVISLHKLLFLVNPLSNEMVLETKITSARQICNWGPLMDSMELSFKWFSLLREAALKGQKLNF